MKCSRMFSLFTLATLVLLTCSIDATQAQLTKKAGVLLLRKLGLEAGHEAGEKAGKALITKAASSVASKSTTTIGQKGIAGGIKAGGFLPSRLIGAYGDDAVRVASQTTAQNCRRLALMADDLTVAQRQQLMARLAKAEDPNRIVEFLYKHRAEIVAGGLVGSFIAKPEAFINSAGNSVSKVIEASGKSVVAPIAEKAARPLGHWIGAAIFAIALISVGSWVVSNRARTTCKPESEPPLV